MSENYFAHESACVDEPVTIGEGTRIWHFSHIMSGARIGKRCVLGQNVFVAETAVLGDGVKVQNNVSIFDGVTLEDEVFCGPSVVFTNVTYPRSAYPRDRQTYVRTLVKRGATIGANATIVCGNTIGKHAFVGAGSVVTKDVPDYALVSGNPARHGGWVCECSEKLELDTSEDEAQTVCKRCRKEYERRDGRVERK